MGEFDGWWKKICHFFKKLFVVIDDGTVVSSVFAFGVLTIDPKTVNNEALPNWEDGYLSQRLY